MRCHNHTTSETNFPPAPHSHKSLVIMFSWIVFLILLFTVLLSFGATYLVMHFTETVQNHSLPLLQFLLFLGTVSLLMGFFLSLIFGRIAIRPLLSVTEATRKVQKGDYSARLNLQGTRELQELSSSFNTMAEELGSVEMLRTDFVNNFSHEFKTPIVSIRGFAKILKQNDLTEEERNEYLDIIISETSRLSELSTNVLNLSKLETQSIITEKEDFDLSELLRHTILLLESKWTKKDIDLSVDISHIIFCGNSELISQVFLNLIDNAIKYSDVGGKVSIRLLSYGDSVVFSVHNNGQPIAETAMPHIFDKFYQGDTSHSVEGNGLGLAVVQKIVTLHNGFIQVKSKPSVGTTFKVTFPIEQKEPAD